MYMLGLEIELKLWIEVAKSSLHSGNRVGSARLHALQMMIDDRADDFDYQHYRPSLANASQLCNFAKKEHVTANEKNIFIHIIIDMLQTTLNNLPKEEPMRGSLVEKQWFDGSDFDEPHPPEDSPDNLMPPADMPSLDDLFDAEGNPWLN